MEKALISIATISIKNKYEHTFSDVDEANDNDDCAHDKLGNGEPDLDLIGRFHTSAIDEGQDHCKVQSKHGISNY